MASNSSPVDLCSSSSNSEDEESADAVEEEELNPGTQETIGCWVIEDQIQQTVDTGVSIYSSKH